MNYAFADKTDGVDAEVTLDSSGCLAKIYVDVDDPPYRLIARRGEPHNYACPWEIETPTTIARVTMDQILRHVPKELERHGRGEEQRHLPLRACVERVIEAAYEWWDARNGNPNISND